MVPGLFFWPPPQPVRYCGPPVQAIALSPVFCPSQGSESVLVFFPRELHLESNPRPHPLPFPPSLHLLRSLSQQNSLPNKITSHPTKTTPITMITWPVNLRLPVIQGGRPQPGPSRPAVSLVAARLAVVSVPVVHPLVVHRGRAKSTPLTNRQAERGCGGPADSWRQLRRVQPSNLMSRRAVPVDI